MRIVEIGGLTARRVAKYDALSNAEGPAGA